MITENKRQEQISERQRAEMKANAGKPVKFDFRSAEQCRIDSANEKYKRHHQTLITKAKELLDFANSGTVTITQGIDGVSIKCKAKVTQANTLTA